MPDQDQDDLRATVAALARRVEELETELARPRSAAARPSAPGPAVSRRALLTAGGLAGLGAAAGIGAAPPAAAATGDPVRLGQANAAGATTSIAAADPDFALLVRNTDTGGWGIGATTRGPFGVYAVSEHAGGHGVHGRAYGSSSIGVSGGGALYGVVGRSDDGYGVSAGGRIALVLEPSDTAGPPAGSAVRGALAVDTRGELWLCTTGGSPGHWSCLSRQGPALLDPPERAYDSRPGQAPTAVAKGTFAAGERRTVRLGGLRGARAAIVTLTVTGTRDRGYLRAWRDGGTEPATSCLNWTAAGQTVATTTTVACSTDQAIAVRVVGGGADLVVDVIGAYG